MTLLALPVGAQDAPGALASVSVGGGGIAFRPLSSDYVSLTLTVAGPESFVFEKTFGPGAHPAFSAFDGRGALMPDGTYTWELVAAPRLAGGAARQLQRMRDEGVTPTRAELVALGVPPRDQLVQSGSFQLERGAVVAPTGSESEEAGAGAAAGGGSAGAGGLVQGGPPPAPKDVVINDDHIVMFSQCVGNDCVNGESFGFDTLRLKENNLRIHFQDTSTSASFPTNDWRIVINDSANGGGNYFAVEDSNAGRQVFRVDAGAPANALRVDSGGDVGIGEHAPVVELHIQDGDSPTLRLEQDGTSGFMPQTWDVAGNEANFFIRDVTNGSTLPFRIEPGASSDALYIEGDDDVGLGTNAPEEALHIRRAAGATGEVKLKIENASTNSDWALAVADSGTPTNTFRISRQGSGGPELEIAARNDADAVATLRVFGSVEATNVTFTSARSAKTAVAPVDTSSVLSQLASLPMAEWRYLTEPETARHVGPMAEDFNAAFGLTGDRSRISVVDANGIALAAVQALYQRLEAKEAQIRELSERLESLERERAGRE